MPYVKGHYRKGHWVHAHYRRSPSGARVGVIIAVVFILLIIAKLNGA